MEFKVKNTIDNSIEFFQTMDEVNEYIQSEIKWFNSPGENERGDGYDESDFIITESVQKWTVMDTKKNTVKDYINQDGDNVEFDNRCLFDTKEEAIEFANSIDTDSKWSAVCPTDVFE